MPEPNYLTISTNGSHEIEIKKSRFITHLIRINSEAQVKTELTKIKKEHWKANHNCSAYTLGLDMEVQRSSDDGEPSGTAGMPMLEVLKKRNIVNTLAVVTRYFGGIKLGTGGLIRAYSHSVSTALDTVGLVKGVMQQEINVMVDYSSFNKLQYFLEQANYIIKDTVYTENVKVICTIDETLIDFFTEQVENLLSGQVIIQLGNKSYNETPVTMDNNKKIDIL